MVEEELGKNRFADYTLEQQCFWNHDGSPDRLLQRLHALLNRHRTRELPSIRLPSRQL